MIIWGTKEVQRRIGYVADFCPLCREPRCFELKRIGMASHVYYLSFGEGSLVGYHRICTTCGTVLNANPDSYKTVSDRALPLPELTALSFPDLRQVYGARLELEKSLRNPLARVEPGERAALLKEPFILLSPKVERRFGSTHFDWQTLATLFGGLFLGLPLLVALVEAVLPAHKEDASLFGILAIVVATGVQMALAGRRWMRKHVYPVLAQALKPLKPTPNELEAVLKDMKTLGRKIGSKVKLPELLAALHGETPVPSIAAGGLTSR